MTKLICTLTLLSSISHREPHKRSLSLLFLRSLRRKSNSQSRLVVSYYLNISCRPVRYESLGNRVNPKIRMSSLSTNCTLTLLSSISQSEPQKRSLSLLLCRSSRRPQVKSNSRSRLIARCVWEGAVVLALGKGPQGHAAIGLRIFCCPLPVCR